ncbi:MAG: YhbY family RNA-binding protein [Dechloromonas sp.]|nr:MAG: YhbY family RNA-binding protein [Dechloromonas sp.]
MLQLNSTQRRELRARAHSLNPVVSIAENGLTKAVLAEIDVNLQAHELIKIRVYGDSREDRTAYLEQICAELGAAPVQQIGKLLVVPPRPDRPCCGQRSKSPKRGARPLPRARPSAHSRVDHRNPRSAQMTSHKPSRLCTR